MDFKTIHRTITDRHKTDKELVLVEELFDKLKAHHPELYDKYIERLESIAYHISIEDAETVVKAMKPHGEKYTYSFVRDYIKDKGEADKSVEYYLAMNMAYNDYYEVARSVGAQNNNTFFYEIAKAFIDDEDAPKHKLVKYFFA